MKLYSWCRLSFSEPYFIYLAMFKLLEGTQITFFTLMSLCFMSVSAVTNCARQKRQMSTPPELIYAGGFFLLKGSYSFPLSPTCAAVTIQCNFLTLLTRQIFTSWLFILYVHVLIFTVHLIKLTVIKFESGFVFNYFWTWYFCYILPWNYFCY